MGFWVRLSPRACKDHICGSSDFKKEKENSFMMNNTAVVEVIQSEGHRSKTEKPNQKIIQEYARGQIPVNINITPY